MDNFRETPHHLQSNPFSRNTTKYSLFPLTNSLSLLFSSGSCFLRKFCWFCCCCIWNLLFWNWLNLDLSKSTWYFSLLAPSTCTTINNNTILIFTANMTRERGLNVSDGQNLCQHHRVGKLCRWQFLSLFDDFIVF